MLSIYAVLQVLLQAANAVTGFLLIRAMDKLNYAWFTVAFGSQTMLSVLADCGLTSSLTALGGPVAYEPARLSGLVHLIRRWRLRFMIATLAVVLPVTWWMLRKNLASPSQTTIVMVLVILTAYSAIDAAVLMTANKLFRQLPVVLKAESLFGLIRLGLVTILFVTGANVITALTCTVVAYLCQLVFLRYYTFRSLGAPGPVEPEWIPTIQSQVRHVLPIGVWHCVQGQISTMILTIFATTNQVADIGALARYGFIFVVIQLPLGHFVLPAIARSIDPSHLRKLILATIIGFVAVLLGVILFGALGAQYCLLLLGPNYGHLEIEFSWYLAASSLATTGHVIWGIALTRGWVRFGWFEIPLTILGQTVAAPLLDLSRITAAIGFMAIGSLVHLVVGVFLIANGLKRFSSTAPRWNNDGLEVSQA